MEVMETVIPPAGRRIRRRMLAGALTGIVTLAALLAVTGAASASAQAAVAVPSHPAITKTGPVFGIYGKCVDVRNASSANLTPVQIYTCNGTVAQQWTVKPGPARPGLCRRTA